MEKADFQQLKEISVCMHHGVKKCKIKTMNFPFLYKIYQCVFSAEMVHVLIIYLLCSEPEIFPLYDVSFAWYMIIAPATTIFIGLLVSFMTGTYYFLTLYILPLLYGNQGNQESNQIIVNGYRLHKQKTDTTQNIK